jgi:hypothetical protein
MPMPKRLRLIEKTARALWLCARRSVVGVVILFSTITAAQTPLPNIARLDRLAQRARSLEAAPGFARARLYGVARNLTAFADRWQAPTPGSRRRASARSKTTANLRATPRSPKLVSVPSVRSRRRHLI